MSLAKFKKLYNYLLWILNVIMIIACDSKSKNTSNENLTEKPIYHKPQSNFSDSLIIKGVAAVFYYPDSAQLKAIKSITDPKILDGTLHELEYQFKYSHKIIKANWKELTIIEAQNVRFLVFKNEKGKDHTIDLNSYDDPYGLFVYNGKKLPILIDMTNLEQGLYYYLKK
ncbi:MAG TPA: hypothetical protein PLS73_03780 [Saprospiraceae bacterium]|nr:hypothetical protein [Saprospiraceae bacterium]